VVILHEAERIASHIFVGCLQIEPDGIATPVLEHVVLTSFRVYAPHQYPFLPQLALRIVLRAHLQEEIHQFLKWLRLGGHDESYDVHEEAGLRVAVEHD
jgi:hypothetical protein